MIEDASRVASEIEKLSFTIEGLEENPQNYAIYEDQQVFRGVKESFLNIRAVRPPAFIMRRFLDCDHLILLSGTLLRADLEDLSAGQPYLYYDMPSPIPVHYRPILYRPVPYPMNINTDPRLIVKSIEAVIDDFPGQNTIIHTTYERSRKLAPHFTRPILVNTPQNKSEILEQFKRDGGVFLASGCAEGLDLRDNMCRLNIIPHLIRPNLGDPVVKMRKKLEHGERWYALEAIKTCIQQYGRSTRHERDASTTVVLDPYFSDVVSRYRADIPKYFLEAISWAR
jgi:Rad3-related DNA helicase